MTRDHMPYMVIEGRLGWLKPYRVLHWTEPKRALHARVLGFPLACHTSKTVCLFPNCNDTTSL